MARRKFLFALLWLLPMPLAAQISDPIVTEQTLEKLPFNTTMDNEPHHHLVLKNDIVKVFKVDLPPRDAFVKHEHDHDYISIVIVGATTVSTVSGQADILTISKNGDVHFVRLGTLHSVRNIGQTAYRAVSIELLRTQTGARNLCGKQIADVKPDCPTAAAEDAKAPSIDMPQFETDQARVTLTRILPHQSATFVEPSRDELIVSIDETAVAAGSGKGGDKPQHPGDFMWIRHGDAARIVRNNSEKEARIVRVEFKP